MNRQFYDDVEPRYTITTEIMVQGLRDQSAKCGVDVASARWLLVAAERLEELTQLVQDLRADQRKHQ